MDISQSDFGNDVALYLYDSLYISTYVHIQCLSELCNNPLYYKEFQTWNPEEITCLPL